MVKMIIFWFEYRSTQYSTAWSTAHTTINYVYIHKCEFEYSIFSLKAFSCDRLSETDRIDAFDFHRKVSRVSIAWCENKAETHWLAELVINFCESNRIPIETHSQVKKKINFQMTSTFDVRTSNTHYLQLPQVF